MTTTTTTTRCSCGAVAVFIADDGTALCAACYAAQDDQTNED